MRSRISTSSGVVLAGSTNSNNVIAAVSVGVIGDSSRFREAVAAIVGVIAFVIGTREAVATAVGASSVDVVVVHVMSWPIVLRKT